MTAACAVCRRPYAQRRQDQRYCSPRCRERRRAGAPMTPSHSTRCLTCGGVFTVYKEWPAQRFCGLACRRVARPCTSCGDEVAVNQSRIRGVLCAKCLVAGATAEEAAGLAAIAAIRAERQALHEQLNGLAHRGRMAGHAIRKARALLRQGARALTPCAECGAGYRAASGMQRYCSRPCARRAQRQRSPIRRAHGTPAARRRAIEGLAAAQSGRCAICGLAVDATIRYPDLRAATLDHVVPLAAGGPDEYANLQLAHLACNVAKGAAA